MTGAGDDRRRGREPGGGTVGGGAAGGVEAVGGGAAGGCVGPRLVEVAREWGRIGATAFGGPPAHIAAVRALCVDRRGWIAADAFEDAVAACNLLPGPASTQLSIWAAWRVAGRRGAVVGGLAFVLPGLVAILALAALFLSSPPDWVRGLGAGAGAAVAAVAVRAGVDLAGPALRRAGPAGAGAPVGAASAGSGGPVGAASAGSGGPVSAASAGGDGPVGAAWAGGGGPVGAGPSRGGRARWLAYALAGGVATILLGPLVVLVLLACGGIELARRRGGLATLTPGPLGALLAVGGSGGVAALSWTALKVGALSYGGGFVIVPLMQGDAVDRHGWMSGTEFLNAVALGQATPGPVVHTVAVVGYAAAGFGGGLLAAVIAFAPSFAFVLLGAPRFEALRGAPGPRAFLDGAGPAAAGAIFGSAVGLARELAEPWQVGILAVAAVAVLPARRSALSVLLAAGAVGAGLALLGADLP